MKKEENKNKKQEELKNEQLDNVAGGVRAPLTIFK
jgi:hypothetical protein